MDDAKRESIALRSAITNGIRDKYKDKRWTSQQCYLCGYSSNGLTLDEAIVENKKHIQTEHAEDNRLMQENNLSIDEIRDSIHDHECDYHLCACKCGCQEGPFCTLAFGPLCSVCQVRDMRGDDEHGIPVEEGRDNIESSASQLATLFLKETKEKGQDVEIPSLGIVLKGDSQQPSDLTTQNG